MSARQALWSFTAIAFGVTETQGVKSTSQNIENLEKPYRKDLTVSLNNSEISAKQNTRTRWTSVVHIPADLMRTQDRRIKLGRSTRRVIHGHGSNNYNAN